MDCLKLINNKEKTERILDVDGVFIAVGTIPNTGNITNLLHLDKNNYIVASEDGKTEIPGIFAAGDLRILLIPCKKIKKIFIMLDMRVRICYDSPVINVINS